jgi:hypothetical protein
MLRENYFAAQQATLDAIDPETHAGCVYKPQPYQSQMLTSYSRKERMLKELTSTHPFILISEPAPNAPVHTPVVPTPVSSWDSWVPWPF